MSSGQGFRPGDLPPGLDEAQLRRLAEEMEKMPVQRALQETVQLLGTLAEARIVGGHRDLGQARLAIDALKALQPVLAPTLEPPVAGALGTSIANLQLLYVRALQGTAAPATPAEPGGPAEPGEPAERGGPAEPAEPAAGEDA